MYATAVVIEANLGSHPFLQVPLFFTSYIYLPWVVWPRLDIDLVLGIRTLKDIGIDLPAAYPTQKWRLISVSTLPSISLRLSGLFYTKDASAQRAPKDVAILGATTDFIHPLTDPHPGRITPDAPHKDLILHTSHHFTNHPTPEPLAHLLTGNATYRTDTTALDPNAFTLLAQGQAPDILWIGCADSRIPETTVCHCKPGEIFVHRNIANTVHPDDLSAASVVEYAVVHLKVNKVVVCGHTKCGGANAALGDDDLGCVLNKWLGPVRE